MSDSVTNRFKWGNASLTCAHSYLMPKVISILQSFPDEMEKKIFDLGCGNGSVDFELDRLGWRTTGIDSSEEGIEKSRKAYPHLDLHLGSVYDSLTEQYGEYPVCLSLEVVEHLFDPKLFAKNLFRLVRPGGTAILSTPFHGYFKNLAISITGKWDKHFTALWDGGHIKFWSPSTLKLLLKEVGFKDFKFYYVGRIPVLAKSMIVVAKRPM